MKDAAPYIALAVGIISLLFTVERDLRSKKREQNTDTKDLESRLTRLEERVALVWAGVTVDFARRVHQPHPAYARRDALVEKYMASKLGGPGLSLEEVEEFLRLLAETRDSPHEAEADRFNAGWLYDALKFEYELL